MADRPRTTADDDDFARHRAEVERLERALRRSERAYSQLRRNAEAYEYAAERGKVVARRTRRDLERSLEELRETTGALVAARDEAERAVAARTRFVAAISHDLRTPICGLVATTQLLLGTELSAEQRELISMMLRSAEGLNALAGDVLDFARLEDASVQLERRAFGLREMMHELRAFYAARSLQRGVPLDVDLHPTLPERVVGDALRLRQVLHNLIDNAFKFTPTGRIVLGAEPVDAGSVAFFIRDTGIGIANEALPSLFDAFTQAEVSTTRRFGGSGLGLSICKRLVTLMGGSITVNSQPGLGTVFRFVSVLPTETQAAVPEPAPSAPPPPTPGARVLVVDDDPTNRRITERLLQRLGCIVESAEDGRSAIARVALGGLDLVFMDVSMPDMDGYDCAAAIRAAEPPDVHVPIVGVSASTASSNRKKATSAGMDAFLPKPYQIDDLSRAVVAWVSRPVTPQDKAPLTSRQA